MLGIRKDHMFCSTGRWTKTTLLTKLSEQTNDSIETCKESLHVFLQVIIWHLKVCKSIRFCCVTSHSKEHVHTMYMSFTELQFQNRFRD
jgi:hypothetical protein